MKHILIVVITAMLALNSAHAQEIVLEYQRGDGMFAPSGKPSPALGTETVKIAPGQLIEFDTDWKNEKLKGGNGKLFGSHLRIAKNTSEYVITLYLRVGPTDERIETLSPQASGSYKADLVAVQAAEIPVSKDDLSKKCILEYQRADNGNSMEGVPSKPLGVESVTFVPGERVIFLPFWKFEKKKATKAERYGSHLRKAVNRGSGTAIRMQIVSNFAEAMGGAYIRMLIQAFRKKETGNFTLEGKEIKDFKHDLIFADCVPR